MSGDVLSSESIIAGLHTKNIGKKVLYYPQVTSTNDVARQEALLGADEGTVVITGEQTAGKGRIKRVWVSPPGSVSFSIILRPAIKVLPYLIMVASLAAVRGIESVTGLNAQIKWPNDVLINGKKVCGILIENEIRGKESVVAVIGIGINVRVDKGAFSPEVAATATSLTIETGKDISRIDITKAILEEFERFYIMLPDKADSVFSEWQRRLVTLGKRVKVVSATGVLEGVAESVNRDGSLLLRLPDGSSSQIVAGDVNLRPQD